MLRSHPRLDWLLATTIFAGFLLAADADPPGAEVVVAFTATRFEPAVVEVRQGARVTFHNMEAGAGVYTVVAADGSFESRPLGRGGEWSHRFAQSGDHRYFLRERPETKGTARVR